jgi:hypothetical protein
LETTAQVCGGFAAVENWANGACLWVGAQASRTSPEFCAKVGRGVAELFGWGRKASIDERAKLIARMVGLIIDGLRTKSYEQFVLSFSNPDAEPDEFQRRNGELYFQMRISPRCWYNVVADYSGSVSPQPVVGIQGNGDDFGVFISADVEPGSLSVDLYLPPGRRSGRDASAMVRALAAMLADWSIVAEIERVLGTVKPTSRI